jgi:hypothetical protein
MIEAFSRKPPPVPPSPLTLSPKGARAISYPWGTANREATAGQRGQAVALAPFRERVGVRGPKPRPNEVSLCQTTVLSEKSPCFQAQPGIK